MPFKILSLCVVIQTFLFLEPAPAEQISSNNLSPDKSLCISYLAPSLYIIKNQLDQNILSHYNQLKLTEISLYIRFLCHDLQTVIAQLLAKLEIAPQSLTNQQTHEKLSELNTGLQTLRQLVVENICDIEEIESKWENFINIADDIKNKSAFVNVRSPAEFKLLAEDLSGCLKNYYAIFKNTPLPLKLLTAEDIAVWEGQRLENSRLFQWKNFEDRLLKIEIDLLVKTNPDFSIYADPHAIRAVMANLMKNAVDRVIEAAVKEVSPIEIKFYYDINTNTVELLDADNINKEILLDIFAIDKIHTDTPIKLTMQELAGISKKIQSYNGKMFGYYNKNTPGRYLYVIRYTHIVKNNISLRIAIEFARDKNHNQLIISNTGSLQTDPEKIFIAEVTTKKNTPPKSSGLGLSISRNIIHAHGGTITANNINEEAVFTITFPPTPQVKTSAIEGKWETPIFFRTSQNNIVSAADLAQQSI